tara:strand:- start:374 stop:547 length:174 start_codon:yes stop_codon:yes gene_type:complete
MGLKKKQTKTDSELLRGVYFRLWEKDNQGHDVFDVFYHEKMTLIINHFKKMLDEEKI